MLYNHYYTSAQLKSKIHVCDNSVAGTGHPKQILEEYLVLILVVISYPRALELRTAQRSLTKYYTFSTHYHSFVSALTVSIPSSLATLDTEKARIN